MRATQPPWKCFREIDLVSTIQALFPQKIGFTTDAFRADCAYLTNQRRRNLPVGESRQRPSGEPATGLAAHSGNWMFLDGTEEALTANVITEKYRNRGLCP